MKVPDPPKDPTPVSGAPTDVARLTHASPKPAHEQTASEDQIPGIDWEKIEGMQEFRALLISKARFVAPACLFFMAYYFALPILVGFAPELMSKPVGWGMNLAYLFGLSQFVMAWVISGLYVRAALRWDRQASEILQKAGHR